MKKKIADMPKGTVFKTSYGLCIVCKICVQLSLDVKPYLSLKTFALHIDIFNEEFEVIGQYGPDGVLIPAEE